MLSLPSGLPLPRVNRLWGLAIALTLLPLWQIGAHHTLRSNAYPYRITGAIGLLTGYQDFFHFFYHLGLYPVASPLSDPAAGREGALRTIRESGHSLSMERNATMSPGEPGKIWLFFPKALWTGSTTRPSIRPANIALFLTSLALLTFMFWKEGMLLLGVFLVFILGSNPFQIQEVYFRENVFGLPITMTLLMMALHLRLLRAERMRAPSAFLLAGISASLLATAMTARPEAALILVSVGFVHLRNKDLSWVRRIQVTALALFSFLGTLVGWNQYFDHKFTEAKAVVANSGGTPFQGSRHFTHGLWHPVFCGLGDFDQKYGYQWLDAAAADYAVSKIRELRTLSPSEEIRPYEIAEYGPVIRDKILADISRDPAWYLQILGARLGKVLTSTTPIFPFGVKSPVAFYFSGWAALLAILALWLLGESMLIRLALFSLPLILPAILVYSGGGIAYYSIFHLVALAVISYRGVIECRRRLF